MAWISAAINAASQAASDLVNWKINQNTNKTNLQINRETNEANAALARQQNDWNLAQWERENEYNSAKAQVQRLLDAGLNPNLVDGAGGAAQLQSAPLANQVPTTIQPFAFQNPLSAALGMEKLRQETLKTKADAKKVGAETEKIYQDTKQAFEMFPFLKDKAQWEEKSAASKAHVDEATVQYTIRQMELDTRVKEKVLTLTDEQINEVRLKCDLIAKQVDGQQKENDFKQFEIDFSKKFGFPLNSSAGQLLLGYICDSQVVRSEIKGELSGGIGFDGFGIKAGGSYKRETKKFNNPLWRDANP